MLSLVTQLCLTLCNPMSPPGSSVHGDSPGKNTGRGCHALLQGIFPTQGLNPCLEDSLPSEPPGKPKNTGVSSLSLLQGILPTEESNQGLLLCRRILYQLSYQGSPLKPYIMNPLGRAWICSSGHIESMVWGHTLIKVTLTKIPVAIISAAMLTHIYYTHQNSDLRTTEDKANA